MPSNGGGVLGKVVDGARTNINGLGEDVELCDGDGELDIAVGGGTAGVGARNETRGNIG
jgi:hypothetical protein